MDKKIKELVEWVAEQLWVSEQRLYPPQFWGFPYKGLHESYKKEVRTKAAQILSHPDLALIDRKRKFPTLRHPLTTPKEENNMVQLGYGMCRQDIFKAGFKPIIPLAEALEVKDE